MNGEQTQLAALVAHGTVALATGVSLDEFERVSTSFRRACSFSETVTHAFGNRGSAQAELVADMIKVISWPLRKARRAMR